MPDTMALRVPSRDASSGGMRRASASTSERTRTISAYRHGAALVAGMTRTLSFRRVRRARTRNPDEHKRKASGFRVRAFFGAPRNDESDSLRFVLVRELDQIAARQRHVLREDGGAALVEVPGRIL